MLDRNSIISGIETIPLQQRARFSTLDSNAGFHICKKINT